MEFFIFLCFMSFVSFAVAFLAYGLVIRLPMLLLGLMLLYYRFGKGGSMDDAPAPSEIKKVSKKSLKHQAKKNKVK